MNSTTKYLARLIPLDAYFFSGRETFDYSSGDILDEKTPNYFVKSEYFPQQTTILGVMRRQLLIEMGLYEEDREKFSENWREIVKIIGTGSFNAENPYRNPDGFGKIKNISPVFLYKDKNIFTPAPLDYELDFEKSEGNCYFNSDKEDKDYKKFIPNLKNFKMKDGLNERIICFNPCEKTYSYDEIFLPDERVGINLNSDEDGYYRQRFYKLRNDFEFCFFMELENIKEENDEKPKQIFKNNYSDTVYIGAEGKPFRLILEEDKTENLIGELNIGENRIVCISDVLLDKKDFIELKENSDFILGKTKYFKNHVKNYNGGNETVKPWLLLQRGSVIYFYSETDRGKIEKIINKKHIKVIGYNYITGGVK